MTWYGGMRRVEVCSRCLGFVVTSTSGSEGSPIMIEHSRMVLRRWRERALILLGTGLSSQPASRNVDSLSGLHRETLLEAQHESVAGQLPAQQVRLTSCADAIHRRLDLGGKRGGRVASSFERGLLRFPVGGEQGEGRRSRLVDQGGLFQVDFIPVDEWPSFHGQGTARARNSRAVGSIQVLGRQILYAAVLLQTGGEHFAGDPADQADEMGIMNVQIDRRPAGLGRFGNLRGPVRP